MIHEPLSILVGALGGQGGGVLAEWLVEAATRAGYVAQATSIPGVAQRTGATTYYVEVYPRPRAELGERMPVLGLYPVPGRIDLVIASELLEAGRLLQAGHVSADRTLLIASTSRVLTTAEKMPLGDGRFSSERLLDTARRHSRRLCAFDMDAAARDAGTVVSSVMLGAIAGSGVLPVERAVYEEVVRAAGVGGAASLRGFGRGFDAVQRAAGSSGDAERADEPSPRVEAPLVASAPARRASEAFPAPARDIVALGYDRVVAFQDARYGELFLERLHAIDEIERARDPSERHGARVVRETARFLALWMAFDDIVRVASLKCRAARFSRVRREIGAGVDDVVRIVDHFKPGIPEIAGMLPSRLARRLVAWDRRRQARGHEPVAWPIHLRTDSIHGFAMLRLLASLRGVRRIGWRYREEQRAMQRWLRAVEAGSAEDAALGYEIALCGRLIKGYGATNERGKANLAHIIEHLADATSGKSPDLRAAAIREAREAALTDEGGKALDAELVRHGAPPRPVPAQPIRWVQRPVQGSQRPQAH